jgi:hypothetical protein
VRLWRREKSERHFKGRVRNSPALTFWGIYAIDFPERPNMKAPRGFRNSLWGLSFFAPFKEIDPIPKFFIPKSKKKERTSWKRKHGCW